jgi:hypothetical protein
MVERNVNVPDIQLERRVCELYGLTKEITVVEEE